MTALLISMCANAQTPVLEINEALHFSGAKDEAKTYATEIASGRDFTITFDLTANKGGIAMSKSTAESFNMTIKPEDPSELIDTGWRLAIRNSQDDAGNSRMNLRVDFFSPEARYFAQCKNKEDDYFAPGEKVNLWVTYKSTSSTKGVLTVYKNGRQILKYPNSPYAANATSALVIGSSANGSSPINGVIENVKIFDAVVPPSK